MQYAFELIIGDPFIYTTNYPDLTVSNSMGNPCELKRVNP